MIKSQNIKYLHIYTQWYSIRILNTILLVANFKELKKYGNRFYSTNLTVVHSTTLFSSNLSSAVIVGISGLLKEICNMSK
jgi:hypothetical protein